MLTTRSNFIPQTIELALALQDSPRRQKTASEGAPDAATRIHPAALRLLMNRHREHQLENADTEPEPTLKPSSSQRAPA